MSEPPNSPATRMATKKRGITWTTSVSRIIRSSSQPPTKPAVTPTAIPIAALSAATATPAVSEVRAPAMIAESMSRPRSSVPNGWSRPGGTKAGATLAIGS